MVKGTGSIEAGFSYGAVPFREVNFFNRNQLKAIVHTSCMENTALHDKFTITAFQSQ